MSESNHLKLRTTIMVACMIVLPLAAVIGFKWPKFSAAEKTNSVASSRPLESAKSAAAPAPAWNETTGVPAQSSETAASAMVVPAGGLNAADNPGYQVTHAANNDVHSVTGLETPATSAVVPTANIDETRPLPTPGEANESSDPFLQIQQRLRALGAIHYSLETWGPQGEAYRFQCRMAAGHNPNYSRHFEATDVEPLRVMHTVLTDVEAWKSGRLP